ncbi:MAG TPA: winged helix-turn-helix domain-containing protein [Pyrinomonadaceae bacterium]|jgi:DNA-binding winged helix-turn-helix (wHTH) protein|nr:winged helix-turn-helix domain-containing protein [Pyrinomonadaceae bacterium]
MSSHDNEQKQKNPHDPAKGRGGGSESHASEQTRYVYEFSDFRLYPKGARNYRLMRNGQPYKIRDMPFRLLCVLAENHGRELSNDELIRHLWPDEAAATDDNSSYVIRLHTQVRNLRKDVGRELIGYRKGGGYYVNVPVNEPEPLPPSPPEDELDFERWLVRSRESLGIKLFIGAGVALSLVCFALYLFDPSLFGTPSDRVVVTSRLLSRIQLAIVTGALIASFWVFDRNRKGFPTSPEADAELMRISGYSDWDRWGKAKAGALSSMGQFSRYWKLLLGAWVFLYLLLSLPTAASAAVQAQAQASHHAFDWQRDGSSILLTVFNNCNSWMISLCFIVLNHPTVIRGKGQKVLRAAAGADLADEPGAEGEQDTSLPRLSRRIRVWGLAAVILFAAVECALVSPSLSKLWGQALEPEGVLWAADFFSGIVGAITLALFVGRIQSKFLGTSAWLPLAFFLYAAIQSLYPALNADEHWKTWSPTMIEAALVLKCLLYLYVAWLFKSGRLLFYLVKVRTVYERVNIDWHDFLGNLNR